MWKTTDRHVQQKRIKAVEAESKLKQVYIPNYNSKVTHTMNGSSALPPDNPNVIGRPCESCASKSSNLLKGREKRRDTFYSVHTGCFLIYFYLTHFV